MDGESRERLVAVYDDEQHARRATQALINAGTPRQAIHVDDSRDHLASVEGEMGSEIDHSLAGPALVGPFTKEMTKGMLLGTVLGALVGVILAAPFSAIPVSGLAWSARLLIVVVAGAVVGAAAGWIIGGAFGARRPDEPLAAETGVTVAAPSTPAARQALLATNPIRLDLIEGDAQAFGTLAERTSNVVRQIGRHMGNERRRD
jgi:hypothetical protein